MDLKRLTVCSTTMGIREERGEEEEEEEGTGVQWKTRLHFPADGDTLTTLDGWRNDSESSESGEHCEQFTFCRV